MWCRYSVKQFDGLDFHAKIMLQAHQFVVECRERILWRSAVMISTVGDLIRVARTGRSQKEFADLLGVKQSSVSRYESGKSSPPVSVIEHCMRLVHTQAADEAPTADQLADRVRVVLADPALGQVRSALSRLVDVFVTEHAQTRTASSALHSAGG